MAIEKLNGTKGIFDYPDASDPSKGTTEQQYQEWVKNHHNVLNDVVTSSLWQPSTAYKVGQVVVSPNMVENTVARVITAGTTSSAEPVWRSAGNTISDGTVTWAILYRTIDYATQAEVTAGTNTTKIVTPAMLGKTFQTDLASEKAGTLNGTNKSAVGGITGILKAAHGGTGTDSLDKVTAGAAKALTGDESLWNYLHRKGMNFVPPTDNTALNKLGMFISNYDAANVIKNQPQQYGQLVNIPYGFDNGESTQFWIDQNSGRLYHRGGNNSDVINNTPFTRFLDTKDLSSLGVVAGDVSNDNAWWVKLSGTVPLIIQGGTCVGNGSIGSYNAFPISFSSIATVIPYAISAYHFVDYLNLKEKSLTGFTVTGAFNGGTWQYTTGWFLAIGV